MDAALLEAYAKRKRDGEDLVARDKAYSTKQFMDIFSRTQQTPNDWRLISDLSHLNTPTDSEESSIPQASSAPAGSASSAAPGAGIATTASPTLLASTSFSGQFADSVDDIADFLDSMDNIVTHYESEIMKTFSSPFSQNKARHSLRTKDKMYDVALQIPDERKLFRLYFQKLSDESIPVAKRQELFQKVVRPLVAKLAPLIDPLMDYDSDEEMDGSGLGALFGRPNPIQPGDVEKLHEGAKNFMADVIQRNKRKRPEQGSGFEHFIPGRVRVGAGPMPEEADLHPLAVASYESKPAPTVNTYSLIHETPTLKFYKDGRTNTIVIAIRGTADGRDVAAWAPTVLGNLANTSRWKEDEAVIRDVQKRYPPSHFDYYAVGHSLGGALADLALKAGLVKEVLSYNPAVSPEDAKADDPRHTRIFNNNDPLGKLKKAIHASSRDIYREAANGVTGLLQSHQLSNIAPPPSSGKPPAPPPARGKVLKRIIIVYNNTLRMFCLQTLRLFHHSCRPSPFLLATHKRLQLARRLPVQGYPCQRQKRPKRLQKPSQKRESSSLEVHSLPHGRKG